MTDRDEQIAGWLDGSLPPEEAAHFEEEMARNPALADQVAAWQGNDDLLRAAFNAPIEQGVDDDLLARMGLTAPASVPKSAEVIDLAAVRSASAEPASANDNSPWKRWALPAGGALAAGIALAVILTGNPSPNTPGSTEAAQFAQAMDRLPSRGEQALPDGGLLSPVLTFAAADGRYCREFTVTGGARPGGGIACKGNAGWAIEAHSATGAGPVDQGEIVAAAGADGSELDAAYARLGASDALSAEAEQALIASGWKKSPAAK